MADLRSASTSESGGRTGVWAAVGAFGSWGVLPLYWKQLEGIAATELIAHRVVWSLVLLMILVRRRGRGPQFRATLRDRRVVRLYAVSAALISGNWLLFVWAVNAGHIVESSLGYFLNPLCNVALGFFLLRERLRPLQWAAVALAIVGVVVQLVQLGRLPWIALGLAFSFALYGLLRKRGPLGPVAGLGLETLLLAPLACGYLVFRLLEGTSALGHVDAVQHGWMLSAGVVTTIPLLLFASAARALPLSVLGLFQYITPTGQFLVGVLAYHESFDRAQAWSFGFIWLALAVFTFDGLRQRQRAPTAAAAAA